MYRTTINALSISALLVLSACSKQAEITPEDNESLVTTEDPSDDSDDESEGDDEDEQDDEPEDSSDDDPPADDDGSDSDPEDEEEEDEDEDEDEDDAPIDSVSGVYSGELTVIITTSFGPDTCAGTASIDIDDAGTLNGTGSCSFAILGTQRPSIGGDVSEDGAVTGSIELSAFGSAFSLAWNGERDENTLTANYAGSDSLVGVGDITYEVIINLEVEAPVEDGETSPDELVDYSEYGDIYSVRSSATYTSVDGCALEYDLYTPDEPATDTLVVIQHGFARSKTEFADMASHLASWGMPALIMDLCHSWAFDVDINQNAADVVDLVDNLWDGPVVYMGHSNGAISSLVAASIDDQTIAVLGLDPVERLGGDHTDIARELTVPVVGIFGEAGVCNSWNSGIDVYMAVPDSDLYRTTEADHCDFEAPTGTVCTLACGGSNDIFSDEEIRSNLLNLGTAYLSWHTSGDEDALEWVQPTGVGRTSLASEGVISPL